MSPLICLTFCFITVQLEGGKKGQGERDFSCNTCALWEVFIILFSLREEKHFCEAVSAVSIDQNKNAWGNGESSSVVWRRKTRTNLWYFTNFSQGNLKYVSVSILDYTATDPELNCRGDDCTAEKHWDFRLNIFMTWNPFLRQFTVLFMLWFSLWRGPPSTGTPGSMESDWIKMDSDWIQIGFRLPPFTHLFQSAWWSIWSSLTITDIYLIFHCSLWSYC